MALTMGCSVMCYSCPMKIVNGLTFYGKVKFAAGVLCGKKQKHKSQWIL